MPALQQLTVLTPPVRPESLCRSGSHTCAACCWGERRTRADLMEAMRRHSVWFERMAHGTRPPSAWALLVFELIVRRGLDLMLAPLLWIPVVAAWLRPRLKERMCCAFLGFTDETHERIGCLLHPSRWRGVDVRQRSAFALLHGLGCGRADYFCHAAWSHAVARPDERTEFLARVAAADWFGYSTHVKKLAAAQDPTATNEPVRVSKPPRRK